jgi:hypothetical protein
MGRTYTYVKGIPIEAQYLYRKAMEMYSIGKTESALKCLRQTLVIAPGYSKALFTMGNCLEDLGVMTGECPIRAEQSGLRRN